MAAGIIFSAVAEAADKEKVRHMEKELLELSGGNKRRNTLEQ